MKCMEYSNLNHINIIPKEDFEDLTHEVFNVISTNISKSLGPLGSSATILDGSLIEATKDGYSILKKYIFHNRYKKMIYNLIKTPCTKMNNTVGDGTTTAITLTNEIYSVYKDNKEDLDKLYRLPREFTKAWDETVSEIINRVNDKSRPLVPTNFDDVYHVAYVVSNGNADVSNAIAAAYSESQSPAIKMKDSPTNESYLVQIEGFEFPANAIDPAFVKNDDLSVTEKDIVTMLFDFKVNSDIFEKLIVKLNDVYRAMNKKLVIIAPDYDEYMLDTTIKGYVNYEFQKHGKLNFSLLQYSTGKLTPFQREDLAVILRSITITQSIADGMINTLDTMTADEFVERIDEEDYDFNRTVGCAAQALITCENGSIFKVNDIEEDEHYKEALTVATAKLDDILAHTDYEKQSFASKVYDARSRVLQLQMHNYIYYIGADSELQKQIIHDAVEDVIKCLRSAIKYGVVPGCQLSIIQSCIDFKVDIDIENGRTHEQSRELMLKRKIADIIQTACANVYRKVLNGPDGDGLARANAMVGREYAFENILKNSLGTYEVFDIATLEFSDKIITSTETDTMVLTAASELIKILISGNQCIFLDADVNNSHQDTVDVYA